MLVRPALKAVYTIAGRRILIETQDDWSAGVVSNLFAGWFLRLLPPNGNTPTDAMVRIKVETVPPVIPDGLFSFGVPEGGVCHSDGSTLYLDFDGSRIVIGPGRSPTVDVWIVRRYEPGSATLTQIISQAFTAALRRCNLFALHGAAVLSPASESAVLIAGPSGSGKSTLTMQLAACGWDYLSDDTLLLDNQADRLEVYALRKFFALTAQTITALQLSELAALPRQQAIKERVTPQDLLPGVQIERARPGAIFFPNLTQKPGTEIRGLTAPEAMSRLLRLCPWAGYDEPTAGKHLAVLAELARTSVAFDFLVGTDVLEDRGLASKLCLDAMGN